VKQGVLANYDADLLRGIIAVTEKLADKQYDGRDYTERDPESDPQYATDVAMRVIADHVRSVSFLVADGVNPSSDGRGYVMRRLIRRACRHGRVLGLKEPFMRHVALEVIRLMGDAYPELKASEAKILKVLQGEEEKFLRTLDSGLSILHREVEEVRSTGARTFPGSTAFVLHDTYGFPLDMTEDLVRAAGLVVDKDQFAAQMSAQRERSRAARASEIELILRRAVKPVPTRFVGYDYLEYESPVLGLFSVDGELTSAKEGDEIALLTQETPFYGESGGQIGDTGTISSNNASLEVIDTQKIGGDTTVHLCRVVEGAVAPGDRVRLAVEAERRRRLRANHSATHLLHLALRDVLGTHVKQAGSRVSDETLRFDFNHYDPLTPEQLAEIQTRVNEQIRDNYEVTTEVLPLEEARKSGAVALFGEKYGESVRVVQIGPRSRELCGGTHALRSGDIGLFTVVSEGSISSGVRRVEAASGVAAYHRFVAQQHLIERLSEVLKTGERELVTRIERLVERNKHLEKDLARLAQQRQSAAGGDLTAQAVTLHDGTKVVASIIEHASPKVLREVADDLKNRLGSGCIALAGVADGKAILLTAVTPDLVSRFHAGKLLTELAKVVGGQGGGRADLAQAGGGDPEKLPQALERFQELVQ
jgi:alanyl-tRNA synthetase